MAAFEPLQHPHSLCVEKHCGFAILVICPAATHRSCKEARAIQESQPRDVVSRLNRTENQMCFCRGKQVKCSHEVSELLQLLHGESSASSTTSRTPAAASLGNTGEQRELYLDPLPKKEENLTEPCWRAVLEKSKGDLRSLHAPLLEGLKHYTSCW